MRAIQVDCEPLRRYGHSKLSKMAAAAILNLFESKIAPLDPPSPKTPPRTKHEVDRINCCRDIAICVSWGHMEPHFGGKGRS